jgi:hypothetical protein
MEAPVTTETFIPSTTEDQLRSLLRLDGVVVGLAGLVLALTPTAWYGDLPGWLSRAAGLALVLSAVGVAEFSRWSGTHLRTAAMLTAEAAFAWTATCALVMALADMRAAGLEVVGFSAVATLLFGIGELRLARTLR